MMNELIKKIRGRLIKQQPAAEAAQKPDAESTAQIPEGHFPWSDWDVPSLTAPEDIRRRLDEFHLEGRRISLFKTTSHNYGTPWEELEGVVEKDDGEYDYSAIDPEMPFERELCFDSPLLIAFTDGDVLEIDAPQEPEYCIGMNSLPWRSSGYDRPNMAVNQLLAPCIGQRISKVEIETYVTNKHPMYSGPFDEPPYERELVEHITLRFENGTGLRIDPWLDFCNAKCITAEDKQMTMPFREVRKAMLYGDGTPKSSEKPLEQELIDACREIPPDFMKIRAILDTGADINASAPNDPEENILSSVFYAYPDQPEECWECKRDDSACYACEIRLQNPGGEYLPQITQFFLDHGFDAVGVDGRAGTRVLEALKLSSRDKYILDACKLLLAAGADPELSAYSDDPESVLDLFGWEAFFYAATEVNHRLENLYEAVYEMFKAKIKGRSFWLIENYDVCVGRKISGITLYSDKAETQGIFPDRPEPPRHENCFRNIMTFDCEGKALCIDRGSIYVNPNIPQYAQSREDMAARFPDVIGHTIKAIDFAHASISKGIKGYAQPIVFIRLDNGKTLRFSINHGEVPQEEMACWFEIL